MSLHRSYYAFALLIVAVPAAAQEQQSPELRPTLDPELQELRESTPIERRTTAAPRPGHGARLSWDDRWGHWSVADQVGVGTLLAATVAFQIAGPRRANDPWLRAAAIDETVRSGLRLRRAAGRQRVRDVSDVFLSITVAWPLLFDALASALWYHESPRVARELALLAVETQFIAATIQSFANMISSRQRPYVQDCGTADDRECKTRVRFRSFFSGHASQSFAGAATTCLYHARVPLYGGGTTEAAPCIAMMLLATGVATFRIMGDMHWATDVLTGAAVGIAVGAVVPALRMRAQRDRLQLSFVPFGVGVGMIGVYR